MYRVAQACYQSTCRPSKIHQSHRYPDLTLGIQFFTRSIPLNLPHIELFLFLFISFLLHSSFLFFFLLFFFLLLFLLSLDFYFLIIMLRHTSKILSLSSQNTLRKQCIHTTMRVRERKKERKKDQLYYFFLSKNSTIFFGDSCRQATRLPKQSWLKRKDYQIGPMKSDLQLI